MKKSLILTAAALTGGFAVLAAEPALAKKPAPQSFTCRTSKGAYRDTTFSKQGVALLNVGKSTFFNYAIASGSIKIAGFNTTTTQWLMPCLSTKDIRTAGVLPLTFRPGGSDDTVAVALATTKVATVTGSWASDENDPNSFKVVFKSYNAATGRLVGTFGGRLIPGETPANGKPIKVVAGKFNVLVDFHGQ